MKLPTCFAGRLQDQLFRVCLGGNDATGSANHRCSKLRSQEPQTLKCELIFKRGGNQTLGSYLPSGF